MLSGEHIAAFTVSEAGAGSDAASITATARAERNGWILNGTKYFCTNGGLADIYLVAMKTNPDAGAKGISLFLVEKGAPGFIIGPTEEKMGCRSSVITSLAFTECFLPAASLIGQENDGFKIVMFGLTGGRLGMASMGLGIAEAAFEAAAGYAAQRMAFGKPLTALYAVQEMLADMYVALEGARLVVESTAQARDSGKDYSLETSVAKIHVARAAGEICHKALQIYGGHGYMKHNPVERFVRDARLMDIGVGSSEVLKMVIAGAIARKFAANAITK
jgi:alkylation response protein AidB-like acyl-CoA dehydrogenase